MLQKEIFFNGLSFYWTSRSEVEFSWHYFVNVRRHPVLNSYFIKLTKIVNGCVLKSFAILTGKYLSWSLFLIKLSAFRPETLLERESNTGVFLWVLQIFIEHHWWQFLSVWWRKCPVLGICRIFKKTYFEEWFWTDFRKWLLETLFLESRFQNHHGSVI